jgi:hypothetical protein
VRSVAGNTLIRIDSRGRSDIDAALAKAGAEHIGALFVAADATLPAIRRCADAWSSSGPALVPVASTHQNYARDGALIAMGLSIPALSVTWRRRRLQRQPDHPGPHARALRSAAA